MSLNIILLAIDFQNFLKSLPYAGLGMLGIFIVIGVIILVMTIMGHIESKMEQKKQNNNKQE